MKKRIQLFGLLAVISLPVQAENEQLVVESRQAAKQLGSQLKAELQTAMKKNGIVAAIKVCHASTDDIANKVSAEQGWKVGRTALKVRNPANKADAWEQKILMDFDARNAKGEPVAELEHYQVVEESAKKVFRYMKAIPTSGVCLSCHGEKLADSVDSEINKLYPQDQARGFKTGDLRGAFTLSRPLN